MNDKTSAKPAPPVVGLDIGHSAVKIVTAEGNIIFPSASTRAMRLGTAEAEAAAKPDRVRVDGTDYFVGDTALIHSNGMLLDGLRDDWIETPDHLTLLVSGWQRAKAATSSDSLDLALGLPSRLHLAQQERLRDLAAIHLQVEKTRISVMPQPLAAFMASVLDASGTPVDGRDPTTERWGVIDIGYYTADFGLVEGGVWSAAGARSTAGASAMAEALRAAINETHQVNLPLRDADTALRTRSARLYGKQHDLGDVVDAVIDAYSATIKEHALSVFGARLPALTGILLAGGAAEVVRARLKRDWPHVTAVATPRFAVATGLHRYAAMKRAYGGES